MSIKKELLSELTEKQLKQLAEYKGINLDLSNIQKKYYEDWNEKDKMVDLISDSKQLTVSEIEKFIVAGRI
ncbi:MAG: hypothetical protein JSW60_05330 [Thermoplasmatales archaeon]|nr:MAG: hypothetical protein JSW60_05330 [Thermoplasmatales archaeon]